MIIYLKEATIDNANLLFEWVNDETVRKSAFNSNAIDFNEHINWFNQKLLLTNCKIYIAYFEDRPIGQIRIDIENSNAIIDYSVDKYYRNKGLGLLLLLEVENEIKKSYKQINQLIGNVKYNNIPSQRTFEKAGYIKKDNDNFIFYCKMIGE